MNKIITLLLILLTTNIYATIYEDAQNKNTIGWKVYDNSPSNAKITNICDSTHHGRVIKLDGASTSNGYMFGNIERRLGSWNNTSETILRWQMKFNENFAIYIRVITSFGAKYLYYTPSSSSKGSIKNGSYIHIGLGSKSKNNTWQTFTRNLDKDLKKYEPYNKIIAINAFLIRGSGLIDNISLSLDKTTRNTIIPIDTNIELGHEKNILYYVDPRPEEGGENRALRINTTTMDFEEINVDGTNPHSIDRAGNSNNFYIRTQNSNSFDIVNFTKNITKTIPLNDHAPRAIGAYNNKYKLQLLSAKNMPIVDVIDVTTNKVIKTLGQRKNYDKTKLTSNAGSGAATGHSFWFDENHFALIDRVNKQLKIYKVSKNNKGFSFKNTNTLKFPTGIHAVERINTIRTKKDLITFYALGEGDLTKKISPFISELLFNPLNGTAQKGRTINFTQSSKRINSINPTTHHAGISPNGKYLIVPIFDGKVYIINTCSMKVVKVLQAKLGAAHVEFSKKYNLAIITNHFDPNITIIDMNKLTVKKHLTISHHKFDPKTKHLLQPHFSYISKDGKYFYTFATQDGNFLKIDLRTLKIIDTLHTGGAPEQAHS